MSPRASVRQIPAPPVPALRPGVVVLTATLRLAREIRIAYDREQLEAGRRGWTGPLILPLEAWMRRLWKESLYSGQGRARCLLPPAAERALWEEIIDGRSGYAPLDLGKTAELAAGAWESAWNWGVPLDQPGPEWQESEDSEAFFDWAREFSERLGRNGWLSGAELPRFLGDQFACGALPAPEEIVLAGFDEPAPALEALLDDLEGRGTRLDRRDGWWGGGPAGEGVRDARAVSVGFGDPNEEIRAAAHWARAILARSSAGEGIRVGVIVPDLARRRVRVERAFRSVFEPAGGLEPAGSPAFHISMGVALADYPVIGAALRILEARPSSMPVPVVRQWLSSPFVAGAEGEYAQRGLLARRLQDLGEPRVSVRAILRLAGETTRACHCPVLARSLRAWALEFESLPARARPDEWAARISALLASAGWPGGGASPSPRFQTLGAWRNLLEELAGLDRVIGPVPFDVAASRLRRLARTRQFQPESPASPVQILGVWEAGGLRFDRLWIAGMDADSWPGAAARNPFLPRTLQLRHGLPDSSPERRLDLSGRLSERMIGSVRAPASGPRAGPRPPVAPDMVAPDIVDPDIVVSWVAPEAGGGRGAGVSPFFAGFGAIAPEALPGGAMRDFREQIRASRLIEILADDRGRPWPEADGRPVPGGTRVFADQAACPFRAYARSRLGAAGPDSSGEGLDAKDRGQLLHDVLERAWGEIGSHAGLAALSGEGLAGVVARSVESVLDAIVPTRSLLGDPAFRARERDRLGELLLEWLGVERARAPFRVVGREVRRAMAPGGLPIDVRVDRVDELEDGSLVLIDYKTRAPGPPAWEGDRPAEPQLPVYAAWMAREGRPLAGLLFAEVRKGAMRFRGLAASEEIAPGAQVTPTDRPLTVRVGEWEAALAGLASEFREGLGRVDPAGPEACRYCDLGALCRVGDREAGR